MTPQAIDCATVTVIGRVYVEFAEMPGLRLTLAQAQRLLGLDEPTCRCLLQQLVDARFLCLDEHDMYARLTDADAVHVERHYRK